MTATPTFLRSIPARHAPTETDAAVRLGAAFCATPLDENMLKMAVCAFVEEARLAGWSAERVLAEVKRIATIDGSPLHPSRAHGAARGGEAQRVANRAVRWCVEYYYWIH